MPLIGILFCNIREVFVSGFRSASAAVLHSLAVRSPVCSPLAGRGAGFYLFAGRRSRFFPGQARGRPPFFRARELFAASARVQGHGFDAEPPEPQPTTQHRQPKRPPGRRMQLFVQPVAGKNPDQNQRRGAQNAVHDEHHRLLGIVGFIGCSGFIWCQVRLPSLNLCLMIGVNIGRSQAIQTGNNLKGISVRLKYWRGMPLFRNTSGQEYAHPGAR